MSDFFQHLIDRHQAEKPAIRPRPRSRFESKRVQQKTSDIQEVDQTVVPRTQKNNLEHDYDTHIESRQNQHDFFVNQKKPNNSFSKIKTQKEESVKSHTNNDDEQLGSLLMPQTSSMFYTEESVQVEIEKSQLQKKTNQITTAPRSTRKTATKLDHTNTGGTSNPLFSESKHAESALMITPITKSNPVLSQHKKHQARALPEELTIKMPAASELIETKSIPTPFVTTRLQEKIAPSTETREPLISHHQNLYIDEGSDEKPFTAVEVTHSVSLRNHDIQDQPQTGIHETPHWVANLQSEFSQRWHEDLRDTEPVVNVTIGRVEIRATTEKKALQKKPIKKRSPVMTLDDYLQKRERRN